jgi:hypothetical protein
VSTTKPTLDPDRRRALDATRLNALVAAHAPDAPRELVTFAGGVALVGDRDLWVLPVDAGRLGAVLAWVDSVAADREFDVVTDEAALTARRVRGLDPAVRVWQISGRSLVTAEAAPITPAPDPPDAPELVTALRAAGLDVVTEYGVVTGEVKGLEVARIVPGDPAPHLVIGVGVFDQGAFSALHADRALDGVDDRDRLVADLVAVRDRIASHRGPGADPHLANRLVRPRWLRAAALAAPHLVGLRSLQPVPLPDPRGGLNEHAPAAALGRDASGASALAVFSVGVDLEMVPIASDLLAAHRAERVLLVLPRRDMHPAMGRAATRLAVPTTLVALEGEWSQVV